MTAVLTHWAPHNWKEAFAAEEDWEIVPQSQLDEIECEYASSEQRFRACASVYVLNPKSSWKHLAIRMYKAGAGLVDMEPLKPYIPPKGNYPIVQHISDTYIPL